MPWLQAKHASLSTAGSTRTGETLTDPTAVTEPSAPRRELPPLTCAFLEKLQRLRLISADEAAQVLQRHSDHLWQLTEVEALGRVLVQDGLVTQYQVDRVLAGTTHGLVLGNHKVVSRLGAGGMGVVFKAEHLYLHRAEAIKVLPVDDDYSPEMLSRFYAEMEVLAGLRHPGIVAAYDAGQVPPPGPGLPTLLYLAMELVDGGDLENYVFDHGPVPIGQACDWIRQAAIGLQHAHDQNLVHRDIKPSNLLLSQQGQVKLVDFGLVRQFCKPLTKRGSLLGTIDYMSPEQSIDASNVGTAADVYGLGASLFWLLTGEPPHPRTRRASEALITLKTKPARSLDALRPDAPPKLQELVTSMLDRDPAQRPTMPLTVARALDCLTSSKAL